MSDKSGASRTPNDPAVVVIFGASGDLTTRKLVPAFYSLAAEGMLQQQVEILGVARSELSQDEFRRRLMEGVCEYGRIQAGEPEFWPEFSGSLSYLSGGYDDLETYRRLAERLEELDSTKGTECNRLFYLAIPPVLYGEVIEHLGRVGLNRSEKGWTRLIVEKPFGRDLASARKLNSLIHRYFNERQVYRIDHYLGKETVQNIMTFRFANSIFEPLWNRNYVDHVQISVLEQVGVGHRGGYYDTAGVLRDMFQNHLLQLLSLTAMEPPIAFNAKALRDEKVKVLQALSPLELADGVWGQYRGYLENPGVAEGSTTPTYLGLKVYINSWRWQGVPFFLRSGKNLAAKATEVTLQFKQVPHQLFHGNGDPSPNQLSLCIQPDEGMHLQIETKIPGAGMRTDPVDMEFHYDMEFGAHALPDAYERLLLDALQGDASLFARSDEIEQAWMLIDPVLKRWDQLADPPLRTYDPGGWGPSEADDFMARDGRAWNMGCGEHLG